MMPRRWRRHRPHRYAFEPPDELRRFIRSPRRRVPEHIDTPARAGSWSLDYLQLPAANPARSRPRVRALFHGEQQKRGPALANHALYVFDKMRCRLLACGGEADHLHRLVEYPPKHSISVLVNDFKVTSSRLLRKRGQTSLPATATASYGCRLTSRLQPAAPRWTSSKSMSNCRGSAPPPRSEGRGCRALKNQ
jgi:Transposase IS200 like